MAPGEPPALRLHALGIDEVRDLVGASSAVAERARAEVTDLIAPADQPAPRGFLGRLLGRGAAAAVDPERPQAEDVETVLSGRYAPPERAAACWAVLEFLVARRAWGSLSLDLDSRQVADLDFALTRAGVPAEAGLGRLLRADARIGLTPVAGLSACYLPFATVRHSGGLIAGADLAGYDQEPVARELAGFLGRLPEWAERAEAEGRPVPDLIAFHRAA